MPEARGGPKLVVATAPTPNGPLHLGHLGGPYVAADVAARAARARGERVLTMSGLDPNQNYVLAKARLEERPVAEVLRRYSGLVRDGFARALCAVALLAASAFLLGGGIPSLLAAAAFVLTAAYVLLWGPTEPKSPPEPEPGAEARASSPS